MFFNDTEIYDVGTWNKYLHKYPQLFHTNVNVNRHHKYQNIMYAFT